MKTALIALALTVAYCAWGDPQAPGPTPSKQSEPHKEQASHEEQPSADGQRGTENAPFVIKIMDDDKADKRSAKAETEGGRKALIWGMSSDDSTAVFTGLLVAMGGLTALVLGCQSWLLRRQVNLAREEFRATHRPRITIRACKLSGIGADGTRLWPCKIKYANIGDSTAHIREIGSRVWRGPKPATTTDREIYFNREVVSETLKSGEDGIFLTAKEFDCNEAGNLWFAAGYIEYSDMAIGGTVRKVGFIRKWQGMPNVGVGVVEWEKEDNEEYEYSY